MSNISADFVLRHLLARIEWSAGQGAEYVIESYDKELIRNALGVSPPPVLPNPTVQPVSYYYLMDGDTVLEGDEVLVNDLWKGVWFWMLGEKKPSIFSVRRHIPAPSPDGYRYLGDDDLIMTTDEISVCGGPWRQIGVPGVFVERCLHIRYRRRISRPSTPAADNHPCEVMQYYHLDRGERIEKGDQILTKSGWVDCEIIGYRRVYTQIRRPLVGCPYPGRDYKAFPKGYFVGKELKEGDAAWDGHNWLPLQSVIDNQSSLIRILKNNFVRRKKIHL